MIDAIWNIWTRAYSRWYAAVYSAKNYFNSILLATLCICVIFFPLLFTMTGQMLDFVTFFLGRFPSPSWCRWRWQWSLSRCWSGSDQEGIEVRAGEYRQEEVQSAGYRTGRLYEGADVDFPFPESHDRFRHPDGCLGDPDDHSTEPAYDADSRPGSVRRRDLSPAEPRWTVPPP